MARCPGNTPNSPFTLGAVSSETFSLSFTPSGVTISREISSAISGSLLQLLRLGLGLFDVADHVEGLLGQIVERTRQDLLEAVDGLLQGHVLAGEARELGCHEERLRKEALNL